MKIETETMEALQSFLDNCMSVKKLREGLYLVMWDYLASNVDSGVDEEITGEFLRDFDGLLNLLLYVEERLRLAYG
jgi:hypothetical protein